MNPFATLLRLLSVTILGVFSLPSLRADEPKIPSDNITLREDDKPAFPEPPAGWDVQREGIPHGKLEMIEYDSKTVGARRKMNVYTPPGYSSVNK